jgi:glyoxylase-like metal-dependent hydrolase (beta-lactamase superfamily II)
MTGSLASRVEPLVLGWEHGPESISLRGGSDERILRLPITAVLVETSAGWVLLDTGLDPAPFRGATSHDIYTAGLPEFPSDEPLLDALDGRPLVAAAVSHLHLDHTGGLKHVDVPVTIQRRELEHARTAGRDEAYVREDFWDVRWRAIEGDAEIAPGIDAVFTPGHTPGHMSYRVRTSGGTWLFACDAIDLQRGIDEDRPGGLGDERETRASHDRLVALAASEGARLVPGHCPDTWPLASWPHAAA